MEVGNFTLPYTSDSVLVMLLLFQNLDKKTFPGMSLNNAEWQEGVFHVGGNIGQRSLIFLQG